MTEADRHMKALGDAAREQAEAEVGPALARPLDEAEIDDLVRRVSARVLPPQRRPSFWRRPAFGAGTAVLAAAAAFLLVQRHRGASSALPPYDLVVEGGGERATRGGDEPGGPVLHVHRDGRIVLVARPRDASGAARAATWVDGTSGLAPWIVPIERSSEGAFRIDAESDALARLPIGASRLIVLIGEESTLPGTPAAATEAVAGKLAGVQALTQAIDVAP